MGILRLIFAIAVVFAHSPWNDGSVLVGGQLAVQLFYVISGFLISHVLTSSDRYKSPRKFYISRWLRLYPIYYAVAFLALLVAAAKTPSFFGFYHSIPFSADLLLVFSNLCLYGQDWILFLGITHGHLHPSVNFTQSEFLLYRGLLIPQAWTLGIELTFYLIAPFVLRSKTKIFTLLGLSLMVRLFLLNKGIAMQDPWSYRFFPAELSLFLLGAISNQYLLPFWNNLLTNDRLRRLPEIAVGFLTAFSIIYFIIPVAPLIKGLTLLIAFLVLIPLAFIFQNHSRLDNFVGQLSYPVYIGHTLMMVYANSVLKRFALQNTC